MSKTFSGDSSGGGERPAVEPRVARRRQDAIGGQLRHMYDSVVNETVPDEFLDFLKQADSNASGGAEVNGATSTQKAGKDSDD